MRRYTLFIYDTNHITSTRLAENKKIAILTDKICEHILDTIIENSRDSVRRCLRTSLSSLIDENPKFHKLMNIYKLAS